LLKYYHYLQLVCYPKLLSYPNYPLHKLQPTLPAEITDAQVTSGVGTDEVLMTPTKLKTAIVAHAPSGGDTFHICYVFRGETS
jgi:hypothetical protein